MDEQVSVWNEQTEMLIGEGIDLIHCRTDVVGYGFWNFHFDSMAQFETPGF